MSDTPPYLTGVLALGWLWRWVIWNKDGWPDVVIGAMDIGNVVRLQRRFTGDTLQAGRNPLVFFENRMHAKSNAGR